MRTSRKFISIMMYFKMIEGFNKASYKMEKKKKKKKNSAEDPWK